jgi:hypothetical protein
MSDEEEWGTRYFDWTASTAALSRSRDGDSPEHEQFGGQAVYTPVPVIADRYGTLPRDPETAEGSTTGLLPCGALDPDSASRQVRAQLAEAQFQQALADLSGDLCQARWTRTAVASSMARLQALAPDPSQEMSATEGTPAVAYVEAPVRSPAEARPAQKRSDRGYER